MEGSSWMLPIVALCLGLGFVVGKEPLSRLENFEVLESKTTPYSLTVQWDMVPHDEFPGGGTLTFSMKYSTLLSSFSEAEDGNKLSGKARSFVYRKLIPNVDYELKIVALWNGTRTVATTSGRTLPVLTPRPPTRWCEEYVGSTCDEHLKGIQIFIENSTDRTMMDEVARTALAKLDGASEDCQNAASAMICQWVFKPCHVQEWVNSKRAVPRPICQEDCNTVRDQACLDVWKTVEDFFEECKDVVVNTSCEHLPRANGGDFAECVSYGALEEKSPMNSTSCYYGKGEGYHGTIHKTKTAQATCLHWIRGNDSDGTAASLGLTFQQAKEMKNYCRNPQGRGSRPWCYDGSKERWAYCLEELRPCDEEDIVCEPLASSDPKGHICKPVPGFESFDVYVGARQDKTQAGVEKQLTDVFHYLQSETQHWATASDCPSKALKIMCYMSLPLCMQPKTTAALTTRPVCRDYCEKFEREDNCNKMVEDLQKGFNDTSYFKFEVNLLRWPLNCATLPSKNGGQSPECVDKPRESSRVDEKPLPDNMTASEACYFRKENGVTYRGVASKTVSGLTCQPWNSSYPHQNPFLQTAGEYPELKENYCRNPDTRADQPWCYTMNSTVRWERCLISQCDPAPAPPPGDDSGENFTNEAGSEKGSVDTIPVAVVGGIAGFVAIALCIIAVLYVVHRRKTAMHANTLPVSLMALNRTRTNSSAIENNPYYTMQERLSCQEISPEKIVFVSELGEGNFGKVFKGLVQGLDGSEETSTVAIKTLKADSNDQLKKEFYHEAQLMSNFNHKNIVKLLGVCVENSATPCMLFEYMELGDLNNFLRECSRHNSRSDTANPRQGYYYSTTTTTAEMLESCSSESVFDRSIDADLLVQVAVQIAAGMYYLSHRRFVHRDLATRNCLITHGLTVKIADFGMSQDIYSTDYYRVGGAALLPVRWMPPEAIVYGKFTVESDVWSFGVVLWEIFSFAMQPYFGFSNEEVVDAVRRGRLLSCPEGCPPQIYTLMKECWNMEPEERPSFKKLYRRLSDWGPGGPIRRHTTLTSSVTTCEDETVQESDGCLDEVFEKGEGLQVQLPPTRNGKLPSAGSDQVSNGHLTNGHPVKITITTAI